MRRTEQVGGGGQAAAADALAGFADHVLDRQLEHAPRKPANRGSSQPKLRRSRKQAKDSRELRDDVEHVFQDIARLLQSITNHTRQRTVRDAMARTGGAAIDQEEGTNTHTESRLTMSMIANWTQYSMIPPRPYKIARPLCADTAHSPRHETANQPR